MSNQNGNCNGKLGQSESITQEHEDTIHLTQGKYARFYSSARIERKDWEISIGVKGNSLQNCDDKLIKIMQNIGSYFSDNTISQFQTLNSKIKESEWIDNEETGCQARNLIGKRRLFQILCKQ